MGSSGAGIFQEVSKSVSGFSRLALFGLVKWRNPSGGSGRARSVAGQSSGCPGSCPFLAHLLPLQVIQCDLGTPQEHSELCSTLQLCVSVLDEGWQKGKRAEGCNPTAEVFPEVTVKVTVGDSALYPALSDKTLLSLQVKR